MEADLIFYIQKSSMNKCVLNFVAISHSMYNIKELIRN